MDIKDLLVRYGVFLSKRYTPKQKVKFLSHLSQEFQNLGYQAKAVANKKGRGRVLNLYVGNMEHADTIFVTGYDTPLKKLGINKPYQPFDLDARQKENSMAQLVPNILIGLGGMILVYISGAYIFKDGFNSFLDYLMVVVFGIYALIAVYVAKGIGNRFNMNRNTSGVVTLLALASQLNSEQKPKVAFAFTDFSTLNLAGDQFLQANLPKTISQKQVIIIDSVGQGSVLKMQATAASQDVMKQLKKHLKTTLKVVDEVVAADAKQLASYYPKAIAISVGEIVDTRFEIEKCGTKHDIEVDEQVITDLVASFKDFL